MGVERYPSVCSSISLVSRGGSVDSGRFMADESRGGAATAAEVLVEGCLGRKLWMCQGRFAGRGCVARRP